MAAQTVANIVVPCEDREARAASW